MCRPRRVGARGASRSTPTAALPARCRPSRPRGRRGATGRSCWGCATTRASAASAARWWASRAGSTARSPPAWPPSALGPGNVLGVAMPSRYILGSLARGRGRAGAKPRAPLPGDPHRADARRLPRPAGGRPRPRPWATSPSRTCRRASAGRSSWPSPTRTGSLLPLHRQQERAGGGLLHALRRHGGRAGRASATCPRPWSTGWPARPTAAPGAPLIPERTFTKPPSAELKPDQTDQDSLPPYEVLDDILAAYVEERLPLEAIVARGHAPRPGAARARHGDPQRVQAPAGGAGAEGDGQGLRRGPAAAHRARLPSLTTRQVGSTMVSRATSQSRWAAPA